VASTNEKPLQRRRGELFRKYAVALATLVSGVLLTSNVIEGWLSYQEHRGALVRLQRADADGAALRIQQFLDEMERSIRWTILPSSVDGSPDRTQQHEEFRRLLHQAPGVTEVSYLDARGKEQVHVSRLALDVLGGGLDRSGDPAFIEARRAGTYFGPVYFRDQSEPYMSIGIRDGGRVTGVTVAEVNLKLVWDAIAQVRSGEAGYAYVVDPHGHLVAHPDTSLVLKMTDLSPLPHVRHALEGSPAAMRDADEATIVANFQDRQVLSTYAVIAPVGWIVFVEQPLDAVFAPLYAALARAAVLLVVALGLAVLASLLLARRLVIPIRALQAGAARVGAGALEYRIDLRTGDELELVSDEFNRMAARLQESYAGLERKVEERTRDLADAVTEIDRQRGELANWSHTLEARVEQQVDELQRLGRLRRFLAPQIAELVVASGEEGLLESHRREIAVVCCGLRGFAAFSETAAPEDVMAALRAFHAAMGELVFRYGGTLERFAGEGLVVFFNDPVPCPDPAARAVRMALAMRERASAQAGLWRQHGYPLAFVGGIAIGYATLGTIGFEGRLDYAAVGSVTTQAGALCLHADAGHVLASQRVYSAVQEFVQAEEVGCDGDGVLKGGQTYSVLGLRHEQLHAPAADRRLSAREAEVAAVIARGLTNRQIAEELLITERTVAAHIEHILTKLDFASRTQIGVWAAERGLLAPSERRDTRAAANGR
jgi:class 3 adenylate cyclase/HAMP domain-containing protein